MDIIGTLPINDTSTTLVQTAYYNFQGIDTSTNAEVSEDKFFGTLASSAIEFNGRLWVISQTSEEIGNSGIGRPTGNIWSTLDGKNWIVETNIAALADQQSPSLITFNDKLWIFGNTAGDSDNTPIWSSYDGRNWNLETTSPTWGPRTEYSVVSFNQKVWIFGGKTNIGATNSIWSSADGINWNEETNSSSFTERYGHHTTIFQNHIWLSGGKNTEELNDIWKSLDGINWVLVNDSPEFSKRMDHISFEADNKLWVAGGRISYGNSDFLYRSDIWSSEDGHNWSKKKYANVNSGTPAVTTYKDQIWFIGGGDLINGPLGTYFTHDQAFSSINGEEWKQKSSIDARSYTEIVEFNGKLWMIGGISIDYAPLSDIWSSEDGIEWHLEVEDAPFDTREGHQLIIFNNKIWLIGGNSSNIHGAIWSSSDGINWTMEVKNVEFSYSGPHQAIVFDDKIWLIEGKSSSSNEVWSSSDGVNWNLENPDPQFSDRFGFQLFSFENKLWITGGATKSIILDEDGNEEETIISLNDVWNSDNGITWKLVNEDANFSPRTHHQALEYNGQILLIGGYSGNWPLGSSINPAIIENDVWSSQDGNRWTRLTNNAEFPGVMGHRSVTFKGKLISLSGQTLTSRSGEVWSTEDGRSWSKAHHQIIELTSRE